MNKFRIKTNTFIAIVNTITIKDDEIIVFAPRFLGSWVNSPLLDLLCHLNQQYLKVELMLLGVEGDTQQTKILTTKITEELTNKLLHKLLKKRKKRMPQIPVSKKALQRFKTLIPGFYPVRCIKVNKGKKSASGSGANVWKTDFETVSPAQCGIDRDDVKDDPGVEISEYFNDNPDSAFRVISFVCAAKKLSQEELFGDGEEQNVDLDACVDEFLIVEVYNDTYQGRLTNKIKGFYEASNTPF